MTRFLTPKTIVGTIVLTLILGIVSSGLWDLLFKPGLTHFGRVALSIITFGSKTVRDSVYASAALDPTPLPSLLIFLMVTMIPLLVGAILLGVRGGEVSAKKTILKIEKQAGEDVEKMRELLKESNRRLLRIFYWVLGVYLVVLSCLSIVSGSIVNQSVVIWRVYHANLRIVGPFIPETEEKKFRARFSAVKTKEDFFAIARDLEIIARKNNTELLNYELW